MSFILKIYTKRRKMESYPEHKTLALKSELSLREIVEFQGFSK